MISATGRWKVKTFRHSPNTVQLLYHLNERVAPGFHGRAWLPRERPPWRGKTALPCEVCHFWTTQSIDSTIYHAIPSIPEWIALICSFRGGWYDLIEVHLLSIYSLVLNKCFIIYLLELIPIYMFLYQKRVSFSVLQSEQPAYCVDPATLSCCHKYSLKDLSTTSIMSRHTKSSKHKRTHCSTVDSASEDYIAQSKSIVDLLNEVVTDRPWEWETYLDSARSAMNALDHVRFFRETNRFVEQIWILNGLQDFAFHEPDSGYIQDIAVWCESSWLRILRTFPDNEQILTGECFTLVYDTSEHDRRLTTYKSCFVTFALTFCSRTRAKLVTKSASDYCIYSSRRSQHVWKQW